MNKEFTITLPDEPFKSTTDLNKTVACTYTGAKILIISVENETGQVTDVEAKYNRESEIDWDSHPVPRNHSLHVLDAANNLFEAAYITHDYTTEEVADYEETLPTGEVWNYSYEKDAIVGSTFRHLDLFYNKETGKFSGPDYLGPGIASIDEIKQSFSEKIAEADEVLDAPDDYSEEEISQVQEFKDWYVNFDKNYAGVDHWKIPFPSFPVV